MDLNPTRRRALAALAVGALLLAPRVPRTHAESLVRLYQITDLGTLSGPFSNGFAINIRGQVAGVARDTVGDDRAFLWQGGVMRDLGTLAGSASGFSSDGFAINAEGTVAGRSDTPTSSHAFLARGGRMSDLGTLGGDTSLGDGINVFQQVAGVSDITTLDPVNPGTQEIRAFLWRNGTMSDLGVLDTGTDSAAGGVNDLGQVTGWSAINTGFDPETFGSDFHAFLSKRGVMIDLGTLAGGNYSQGNGTNDRGQVAGFSKTLTVDPSDTSCGNPTTFHEIHAALWQRGMVTDLPPLPGDSDSIAFGINDWGQVVGRSGTVCSATAATIWQNGTVIDLNTVIPASSGWFLTRARAINDFGQITGQGTSPNGDQHAYLSTPAGYGTPHPANHASTAGAAQAQSSPGQNDFRHGIRPPHGSPQG